MKFLNIFVVAASLVSATPTRPSRALYFLDSDPQGASVVSFAVAKDGSLGEPRRTSTGGKGLIGITNNGTATVDPLFSQNAIIVSGDRLFTVNAGSNTLASFKIPKHDPTHPVLVGEPVDTVGNVPNTVAYSEKNKIACVANTGSKPGAQCFRVSHGGHLKPLGEFKPLPVRNQTVPPSGAPNTVSDIYFNPSETALFVTIKGDGTEDGFVYAYKIKNGEVGETPVTSRPAGVPTAFGTSIITDSSAVVATPGFGAAFVSIADDLSVTVDALITIANQSATCWTVLSEDRTSVYLLDAGIADITPLNSETAAIGSTLPGFQNGGGNFDGIIGGTKLYALERAPAIAIFDLEDRTSEADVVDLAGLGNRAGWIGLAYYSS